jgi:hypothetical protein
MTGLIVACLSDLMYSMLPCEITELLVMHSMYAINRSHNVKNFILPDSEIWKEVVKKEL